MSISGRTYIETLCSVEGQPCSSKLLTELNREMKPLAFFTKLPRTVLAVQVSCSTLSSSGSVVTPFWPWPRH
ncbi:hypothetical protein PVL29_009556 [Vitis rotundifolia]|uniref:Uncharacterized protein n=1 Tax=Vitis rotundifolia TaxID=103349 RepID=A0AA38ZSQ3_VITRO|nr:hypothetical protein PVL29_009556 [Vitis rotundifolia]